MTLSLSDFTFDGLVMMSERSDNAPTGLVMMSERSDNAPTSLVMKSERSDNGPTSVLSKSENRVFERVHVDFKCVCVFVSTAPCRIM